MVIEEIIAIYVAIVNNEQLTNYTVINVHNKRS